MKIKLRPVIIWLLMPVLSQRKWYRKRVGGVWYKIQLEEGYGIAGPMETWRRRPPGKGELMLDREVYC